jgi:nucleoside-diphosphate kinase
MATERTLVLVKPDGLQRGLVGEVIGRFERRGLHLVGLKHRAKPFFRGLVAFVTSSPVVAMCWEGPGVIEIVRTMLGATNPANAEPGTIRGDLAIAMSRNIVHASDGPVSAGVEVALFFEPAELLAWTATLERWIIE